MYFSNFKYSGGVIVPEETPWLYFTYLRGICPEIKDPLGVQDFRQEKTAAKYKLAYR